MRNYYKRPGLFGGAGLFPTVLKYLLIANVAVFILQSLFFVNLYLGEYNVAALFQRYCALWPLSSGSFLPWQIFTYMFMHGGFMHLFLNMFILWMFGVELENMWGPKKFLLFYLMCGIAAALANLLIAPLVSQVGPTVGASGAIYGVLVAFAYLFPDRKIYIYFFIPVKAKYMIFIYMAFDLFSVVNNSGDGIAHVAHLGGAVAGFLYLYFSKSKGASFFSDSSYGQSKFTSWRSSAGSKKSVFNGFRQGNGNSARPVNIKDIKDVKDADYKEVETDYKRESDDREKDAQEKIDAILDKLSEGGYQSLSEEEKRVLFQESKKLR